MKKLGFGFMRLPVMPGGGEADIDIDQTKAMVDMFLSEGFTYFDTAHGYMGEKCEAALKTCLTERYPRSSYVLADKLTDDYFGREEDIMPFFEKQLKECGVDYFDYYLLHSITKNNYGKFTSCGAFDFLGEIKADGRARHIGISFHDKADMLRDVLTAHPEIEVVQIQFNYADYDSPSVESGDVYRVCSEFGKKVLVMEPVKGGVLANLPEKAAEVLDSLEGGSQASYAIRFAAGYDRVLVVLSGMSDISQMKDNLSYMKDFVPLSAEELDAIGKVNELLKDDDAIPCTACRYCVKGCPMSIRIPDLFSCMNCKRRYNDWNSDFYYEVSTQGFGKASDCIGCGKCEETCPQHLPIRELLRTVAEEFEKEKSPE